jgi:uncharacterized protein YndB with AHSA1/START domain
MSTSVSVSRTINAPAEHVWSLISDVTRMGEWSPETTGCQWLKGATGPAVGARFSGANENAGKKWKTACKVNECEPGKSFGFGVYAGPLRLTQWSYNFEPSADGSSCVVTESTTNFVPGPITKLGKFISGVKDRESHNRAGMEVTLTNLAAAAEAAS